MDSPFPGIDPYLEESSGWPGVHHRLISVLSDVLSEQVAPRYTVSIEERATSPTTSLRRGSRRRIIASLPSTTGVGLQRRRITFQSPRIWPQHGIHR